MRLPAVGVLPVCLAVGLPKAMAYWNKVSEQLDNRGEEEPPSKEPPGPGVTSIQGTGGPCTARVCLREPCRDGAAAQASPGTAA